MKGKVLAAATLTALLLITSAYAPVTGRGSPGPAPAEAAVTKSVGEGSGGGNVNGAGSRLGDLLSRNGVPVLIAFAGVLLIGALASRNVGAGMGIVLITMVGLIFLLAPDAIAAFAKGVANVVF